VVTTLDAGILSGNQILCENSTAIYTSTVFGGLWASSNPSVARVDSISGLIFALRSGTTTITYTVLGSGSCPSASASRQLTVIPSPTAGISSGGATGFCIGSTITLTASPNIGVTYQWILNGSVISGQSASSLTAISAGNYQVVVTSPNGCRDTSSILSLSIFTSVQTTIFDTLCFPSTLQFGGLTLNSGGIYQDTLTTYQGCDSIITLNLFVDTILASLSPVAACPGGNVFALTTGQPTGGQYFGPGITGNFFNPAAYNTDTILTYFYVVTSPITGCRDTAQSTIRILAPSSVAFTPTSAFCLNDTLTPLTGGSPIGGVYSGPGVVSGQFFNPQLAGVGSHLITYTINRQGGCTPISVSALVTVNPLPLLVINPIPTVCQPSSIDLTLPSVTAGSGSGLILSYWLDQFATQPLNNPAAVTSTGTYYIKAINSITGCFDIRPVNVLIRASDTVVVETTICSPSIFTVGTQQFAATGFYQVRLSNVFGCDSMVFLRLTVVNNPVALINPLGPTAFCSGDSVVLQSNQGPGINVRWLFNGNTIPGAIFNTYTARDSGQYQAVVSFGGSCTDTSAILSVTVNSPPTATISTSGNVSICQGDLIQLTSGFISGATYTWYRNGFIIPGQNTRFLQVSTAGSYYVRVANVLCEDFSDTLNLTVNPRPIAQISTSGTTSFCQGGSVILNATQFPGATFSWLLNGSPISGATSPNFTAVQAGLYQVVLTLGPCTDTSASINVSVLPRPLASITAIGDTSFCEGFFVRLSGPATNGISYTWLRNGVPVFGQFSRVITVTTSGIYRLVLTNPLGCSDTSAPQITIMRPRPAAPIISLNSSRDTLRSSVAIGNQWFYNGLPIAGATNQTLAIGANGFYFSVVIGANGCPSDSSNVINITTVNTPEEDDFSFSLFPNPSNGMTWLELDLPGIKDVEVEITTVGGALIKRLYLERTHGQSKHPVDLSDVSDGVYFVNVKYSGSVRTKKLILKK